MDWGELHTLKRDTSAERKREKERRERRRKRERVRRNVFFCVHFNFSRSVGYDKGLLWETEVPRQQIKKFEGNIWMAEEFPLTVQV